MPIRKDPAGFKTTELGNARILVNLTRDFEELVLNGLARAKGRQLSERELIIPTGISSLFWKSALIVPFPSEFMMMFDTVDQVEMFIDEEPAARAAARMAWVAQAQGIKWASKNLIRAGLEKPDPVVAWAGSGRFGITDKIPSTTNTKPFTLPPDQKMIAMYKERIQSEIKSLTSAQSTAIKRAITEGFQNGETTAQIARRIKDVTEKVKGKAITIARTETLAAGNAAAKQRYADAGVQKVEWIAAYDDRVCDDCESKHGEIYSINDRIDIPLHPNCRCTLVPYIEKEE
jgi:SPP1 gp7 family putative phage head morphogenesis protein